MTQSEQCGGSDFHPLPEQYRGWLKWQGPRSLHQEAIHWRGQKKLQIQKFSGKCRAMSPPSGQNLAALTLQQYWRCPPSQGCPDTSPFRHAHRRRPDGHQGRQDNHCLWADTGKHWLNTELPLHSLLHGDTTEERQSHSLSGYPPKAHGYFN